MWINYNFLKSIEQNLKPKKNSERKRTLKYLCSQNFKLQTLSFVLTFTFAKVITLSIYIVIDMMNRWLVSTVKQMACISSRQIILKAGALVLSASLRTMVSKQCKDIFRCTSLLAQVNFKLIVSDQFPLD